MKIITTLIGIIGFQYISIAQTTEAAQPTLNANCSVAYSETSESFVAAGIKCREITIVSLPPVTQALTNVNIEFGMTGSFTLKKDASLELHENVDVYIEDMLTGKVFDLKTMDNYTFNVNRRVPNRFVLHIDKMLMRYAVSAK